MAGIINPQTQSGRTFAVRDGITPQATFYWNPGAGNWLVWDSTVGINAEASNVALENGGNLARILSAINQLTAAAQQSSAVDTSTVLLQILAQLQFIATALNAPIVDTSTSVTGG